MWQVSTLIGPPDTKYRPVSFPQVELRGVESTALELLTVNNVSESTLWVRPPTPDLRIVQVYTS
jgi:hypothetical protein